MAVRTEDHPIEYADFEGVIPKGEYGPGTVKVWDKGTYDPEGDLSPERQLTQGKLKVVLHGKKLLGGFVLIYPGKSLVEPEQKTRSIDQAAGKANLSWRIDDPALGRSVLSGRTLKEIATSQSLVKHASR